VLPSTFAGIVSRERSSGEGEAEVTELRGPVFGEPDVQRLDVGHGDIGRCVQSVCDDAGSSGMR
jgi:hypothetical protein